MNAKKNGSLNSPMKKTTFPIDIANFQNASNSSQSTISGQVSKQKQSILICQKYRDEAVPNFFQYNDRLPLLLSSDEEDTQQMHYTYDEANQYVKKSITSSFEYSKGGLEQTNEKQNKQITPKDHIFIKDFTENEEKETNKQGNTELNNKILPKDSKKTQEKQIDSSLSNSVSSVSPKKVKKKFSVTVAKSKQCKQSNLKDKLVINEQKQIAQSIGIKQEKANSQQQKSLQIEDLIKYENKPPELNPSKVEDQNNKESYIKEKLVHPEEISSISSNTGHILEKIKHHEDSVSLGEHQQSQKHEKQPQNHISPAKIIEKELNQSIAPQKRRRNRIFQGSSARNRNKQYITPEKGIQTEAEPVVRDKQIQYPKYDLYPQIKALNILGKIVEQISPQSMKKQKEAISKEQSRQIWSSFIDSLEILEQNMLTLRNINEIEEIQLPQTIKIRADIKQIFRKQKLKLQSLKKKLDSELQISQIRLLSKFQQIQKQFQIIDFTLKNMINSKYSLASLARRTKDLMVLINKGEYKKTYSLLEDFSMEIQKMKNQRASCGTHRLEKIFKQFLEGQIRQLEEVQVDFRNSLKGQVDYFKL